MEVQLEAVDIYLMHRQTHVILFNLVADNLSVSVVLTMMMVIVDSLSVSMHHSI